MKTWFSVAFLALALSTAALNAADFPVGTYMTCALGADNPSGNNFLRIAGFQDGAQLTLAQSGSTVTSTYVGQNGEPQSLRFAETADTLASIAQKGQVIPGFKSLCVQGPGNGAGYPASMTVTAGALTYDSGMVFLNLMGDLRSDAGACGTLSQPDASFWIGCQNRQGGAAPTVNARLAEAAKLPTGRHSCRTQIETLDRVNGLSQHVAGGETGTLTLTDDGVKVTAQYGGDTSLAGTLRFKAKTSTTAGVEAGQTMTAPCMGTGRPSRATELLPITAGSLTTIDSMLFLSFAGAMPNTSSCPGAQVMGTVICSK